MEAAVIVPLTMIIIVTMLYVGFFVHDKVVMEAIATAKSLEQGTDSGTGRIAAAINDRTIRAKDVAVSQTQNSSDISLRVEGRYDWRFAMIKDFLGDASGEIGSEIHISNLDGRAILLNYRLLKDAGSALRGEEQDDSQL